MITGKPRGRGIKIYSKYPMAIIQQYARKLKQEDFRILMLRCDGFSYKQIANDMDFKLYQLRNRIRALTNDLDKLLDWNEAMK